MLIRRKVQTALAAVLLSAAVPGYVSAQLPGAGKSATGSADRKALDQKVLRDLNPTKVTGVDTLTWNQVLSNDWQLQQQQQRILQSMTTPY